MSMRIFLSVAVAAAVLGAGCLPLEFWRAEAERRQKQAFEEGQVAEEVVCDKCGATSKMVVSFKERLSFQVCPECGERKARPVVYHYCAGPDCNEQLIRFVNHAWDDDGFNQSPQQVPVCSACGDVRHVAPMVLHLRRAAQIAEQTGQAFPLEGKGRSEPATEDDAD